MRRTIVAAGVLALVAGASFTASADGAMRLTPRDACNDYTDAADDAFLVGAPGERSSRNYDIQGVSYRLSDVAFSTVIRVPGLASLATPGTGDTWTSDFTVRGHAVQIKGSRFSPFPRVDPHYDAHNRSGNLNTIYIDGVETREIIPAAEFDIARGFVSLSVAREVFEKLIGGPVTELSKQLVVSNNRVGITVTYLDEAPAPAKSTLDPTGNACFA